MHPNESLIAGFYAAFGRRDAASMAACYHPDAAFSDEVFPDLRGPRAGAMWSMLCSRADDLKIEASGIRAGDTEAFAHWEAWYTFSATGRKVHNKIDATFTLRDGLIVRHVDRFDFWAWSRQALGPVGWLLGWSGALQAKVQRQAADNLERYLTRSAQRQQS